jgi:GNAT superfamily N-acetyltransferase
VDEDVRVGAGAEAIESVEQFASMWQVFLSDRGAADITDRPGMAIRWADSAFPCWNMIFLTEQHVDPPALAAFLKDAAAYMRAGDEAGMVCVCEEYLGGSALASLPDALSGAGLEVALTMHGMAGDFLPIPPPTQQTLRFERVTTEEQLQAYADINSLGYGFPLTAGRAGLAGLALWKEAVHSYIGYENGVPVSAAATLANDGCLFLALVATVPAAQRKGYGEATVRKALHEGARATGLTRTVLHTTDAGLPVYQRIGYRKVSTIRAYKLTVGSKRADLRGSASGCNWPRLTSILP